MKTLKMVKAQGFSTALNPWLKGMPKASKTPEGYTLKVDGKEIKTPEVMITGGGSFPTYTYIKQGEEVSWFAGSFEAGTAVEVVTPVVAAPVQAAVQETIAGALATPAKTAKSKK